MVRSSPIGSTEVPLKAEPRRLDRLNGAELFFAANVMISRRILFVQYTDPAAYPPVQHSSRILAEQGWEVAFLGVASTSTRKMQMSPHARIQVKTIRFVEGGLRQKLNYFLFFFLTLYWIWRWRPSWIYASDPLSCPIVWLVQKLHHIKFIYHEHDSPNVDRVQSGFMKAVLTFRKRVAQDADLCVLPQHDRLSQFLETTGRTKPAFCVWNCPSLDEITDVAPCREQGLIIYYHGSITSSRLPKQLIIAAARLKGVVRIRIAGYETLGSVGYLRELVDLAAKIGAPGIVECLGTIPTRRDLFRHAAQAHIGLALMPKKSEDINMQNMVGASNKPFDYMACGLPLLVTDLPEWTSTFVEPGYARACNPDDTDLIEAELRWFLDHPKERSEMGQRGQEKIRQGWNYESMFSDVLKNLERC